MWYGKYENYTDDDWEDNIPVKTKQLTLSDLQKMMKNQKLKDKLTSF